jgi:hypothetical protein
MTQPFESTFVLFVDMLGFASLVEDQWIAGAHQTPAAFVTAVKASNDRMRGS